MGRGGSHQSDSEITADSRRERNRFLTFESNRTFEKMWWAEKCEWPDWFGSGERKRERKGEKNLNKYKYGTSAKLYYN